MKINDFIMIKPGLNVYDAVCTASALRPESASASQPASESKGIGKIKQFDHDWVKIQWLKEKCEGWWYLRSKIKNNFTVIENTSIINILYGANK